MHLNLFFMLHSCYGLLLGNRAGCDGCLLRETALYGLFPPSHPGQHGLGEEWLHRDTPECG